MVTVAALVIFVAASSQDVPTPLSPANLPPPLLATPTPTPVGEHVNMGVWFDSVDAAPEACLGKALAAFASYEGFRFAEITGSDSIEGYTNTCRLAIIVLPGQKSPFVNVLCVSRVGEPRIVANSIGNKIGGAVAAPNSPRRIGTRDPILEMKLLPLTWKVETFAATRISHHCLEVAILVHEKQGYTAMKAREDVAFLYKTEKVPDPLIVYERRGYKPFRKGEDWALLAKVLKAQDELRRAAIYQISPGPKEQTINVLFAATSDALDHGRSSVDLEAISAAVSKLLFE